jgi:hypothetical protein
MSLNTGNESAWSQEDNNNAKPTGGNNAPLGGLAGLFALSSMTSDNRNLKEVSETMEKVAQIYEQAKKSTTNELQRKIIPTIESLTSSITPLLPGLGFHCTYEGTMYIMGVLFSNRNLTIGSERITINNNHMTQQVSIPVAPAQYANPQFLEKLKGHYTKFAESKGIKSVSVINMVVVDLEMLAHPEAGEQKDWAHNIANFLASEWEEAIMVKSVQEICAAGYQTPNPFANPDQPYGKDNCAEARVSAISSRVTKAKTLMAANMEVIASTINNANNMSNYTGNSKEIARVTAIVGLNAVSMEEHSRFLMSHRTQEQLASLQNFMGAAGMGGAVFPNGYRPLRPVITVEAVQAGEQLQNNGGLYPFFYGLYLLMTTNNNYVFAEALRRHMVGARGNLADLEVRINQMLAQIPGGLNAQRITLDEKKIADTDLVNQWIRQNVSPHATFQVNLISSGPHASIMNFLFRLASKNNANEVKTTIALIDAMTRNKLSDIIKRNIAASTGWNPSKPVLLPTGMIAVNGLATYGDKKLNTQEVDEMMISHIKGKNGQAAIESYLGTMYGSNPHEEFKQRAQKLRVELSQSVFDGQVHINGFAQPHIWAPDFMAALGEAMDSIGQLNVANNLGSWRSNALVYAPGVGLATASAAGSNNPSGSGLGVAYNMGSPFM